MTAAGHAGRLGLDGGEEQDIADRLIFTRSTLEDAAEVIAVRGEFDSLVAGGLEFTELLNECIEARRHVVLDLSDTGFIDSTGLGVLVAAHRRLAEVGRGLVLLRPRSQFTRLLDLTGLDKLLPTVASAEEARAALTASGGGAAPGTAG